MLKIENLTKTFQADNQTIWALKDISFSVNEGEFVAIQGPSGCGKTTLLLTIGGLLKPDSGTIMINDINPYSLSTEKRAKFRAEKIGFVFQEFYLIPYLSVIDNILVPTITKKQTSTREYAYDLIKYFKLQKRINYLPYKLSSGERQRVALARALLNHPKLILADEPTGNLDYENAHIILKYLVELAEDKSHSIILVTHNIHISEYAHRVLHIG